MDMKTKNYRALISSDWNQCLAPCGPFDVITFTYPQLALEIETVFKKYTGNIITLGSAVAQIGALLPEPVSLEQMDSYLDSSFTTYSKVAEFIEGCLSKDCLFMINTTGPIGYFQRVFEKKLLPKVPVLAANPMIRYPGSESDPLFYELMETQEKGKYTDIVLKKYGIFSGNTVIIGDSGGDGPHFEWGSLNSIYKIASMTKQSLLNYCLAKNITIDQQFGPVYDKGEKRDLQREMAVDFLDLLPIIEKIAA